MLVSKEPSYFELQDNVLGVTAGAPRSGQQIYIFQPAIRRTLKHRARSAGSRTKRAREREAGAIARVLVHETVHATVPGQPHASTGVLKARLSVRSLTSSDFALDGLSGATLRAELEQVKAVMIARR